MAVVEAGSLRAAARRLGLSQAGLTTGLQGLEASLGVLLLRRSVRGAALTEEGERLLPRARLILREALKVQEEAQQARSAQAGSLSVGLGPTPTAVLLPLVVPEFHRRFPAVQLRLFSGFYEQLAPDLQQGRIELAVTAMSEEGVLPGLVLSRLFKSALVVVARRGHPQSEARALAQLQGQEWVLLGSPGGPGGTVLRSLDIPAEPRDPEELQRALNATFSRMYGDAHRDVKPGEHPGMHRTDSVDYAIMLEGELVAIMDEGETVLRAGDVLIQRGTSHAWANRSGQPARIAFVLVSGQP